MVIVLLLYPILSENSAQNTQYPTALYTIEDGLSHNSVQWIEKDRYGFIWTSTFTGLDRFDGTGFKNYAKRSPGNFIFRFKTQIKLDSKGELWFFDPNDQCIRYDYRHDSFYQPFHFSEEDDLHFVPIREENGDSWAYNESSIYRISGPPYDSARIAGKFNLDENTGEVLQMLELSENEVWLSTTTGLYHLSDTSGGIKLTRFELKIKNLNGLPRIDRIVSWGDKVWILSDFKIYLLQLPSQPDDGENHVIRGERIFMERKEMELERDHDIFAIAGDGNRNIYFRTMNGVYQYAFDSKEIVRIYEEDYGQLDGGEGEFQFAMIHDQVGILWVGTDKGLLKIITGKKAFRTINPEPGVGEEPKKLKTNAVLIDKQDNLWIGTVGDGLYRGIPDRYGTYERWEHYMPDPADPFSLLTKGIWVIYEDARGNIWIPGQNIDLSGTTPRSIIVGCYLNQFNFLSCERRLGLWV